MKICALCGAPAECKHHMIFGMGLRDLADEDNLTLDLCNKCHNMGQVTSRIHDNVAAEKLSKMLGQALWEINHISYEDERRRAREAFTKRYGRNYL